MGFYSSSGTSLNIEGAQRLSLDDIASPIDFAMLESETITGSLSRPAGVAASDTLFAEVHAIQFDDDGNFINQFSRSVTLPSGEMSAAYSIDIPSTAVGSFRIQYLCFSCSGIVMSGYFESAGTTLNIDNAQQLSPLEVMVPINITMIQAAAINGELSRPPVADLSQIISSQITVTHLDENGIFVNEFSSSISFNSGERSKPYSVDVPPITSCLLYTSPSPRD